MQISKTELRRGGGGGYSIAFYTEAIRPEVQNLTLFIYHFDRKGNHLIYLAFHSKWYPFHSYRNSLTILLFLVFLNKTKNKINKTNKANETKKSTGKYVRTLKPFS